MHDTAGFELIQQVKAELPNLPTVLQSADAENARYAYTLKSNFINKNSESLLQDLKSFINYYLGFGHFVYRDDKGRQIAVAKSMKEFESYLETIPEDSLALRVYLVKTGKEKDDTIRRALDIIEEAEYRDTVIAYVPSLGRSGGPAWVLSSWVGGGGQILRLALTCGASPTATCGASGSPTAPAPTFCATLSPPMPCARGPTCGR
jgi:hypothetical protein